MTPVIEIIVAILLVVGAGFAFIGSLGLVKLPDFFMRLHGPTKSTTLGIGSILGASILFMAATEDAISFNEFLITLFLFITAPVSAHLVSKAALHIGVDDITGEAGPRAARARTEHHATGEHPPADPLDEDLDKRVEHD